MYRIPRFAVTLTAASLLAAPAIYAAPVVHAPVLAMFSSSKGISLNLRNETGVELQVKAGDQVVVLPPGKPVHVKCPEGTRIVATNDVPHHATGSLIELVIKEHSGATIVIR